jgi:hypothetical protein
LTKVKEEEKEGLWVPYEEVIKYLNHISAALTQISNSISDTMKVMDDFVAAKENENNE